MSEVKDRLEGALKELEWAKQSCWKEKLHRRIKRIEMDLEELIEDLPALVDHD